jgi:hypothetical protein
VKDSTILPLRGAAFFSLCSALALHCGPRPFPDVTPNDAAMDRATTMDGGDSAAPPDDVAVMDATSVDAPAADVSAVDAPPLRCATAEGTRARDTSTLGPARATIVSDGCLRRYRLEGPAPEREPFPTSPREWSERADRPRVRTRNTMFDALYSLAVEEARENSVDSIRDGAFSNGMALPCPAGGCFETGRLWTYVWTRDTAFSVHLGLDALDPTRARNSLSFKLSPRRDGSNEQIVQDTGTGGSYPVSTDRVSWALGASSLIPWLDDADRRPFDDRAFNALRNTAEHDRLVAYDPVTGLYRGEQSFLDWREQSYPGWTAQDTAHIAMSHSLSTNALHFAALDALVRGATQRADAATAARYTMWRDALAARIRERFWLSDERALAGFTTTTLDPAPVRRWDLLASSLAVSLGIVTGQDASDTIANYPFGPFGPPVFHPQQQGTAIYHNRAAWPFVTAFALRAARDVRNNSVANESLRALMEGAARFRTHAENYEFVTGRSRLEDGAATGPVVNSPRQLWSVAGYLGAVHDVIFGLSARGDALRVRPYVTGEWRRALFDNADSIVLDGFRYRGASVTVELVLPPLDAMSTTVALRAGAITLDGAAITGDEIPAAMLSRASEHRVRVQLVAASDAAGRITRIGDTSDYRRVFGPRTPNLTNLATTTDGARLRVDFDTAGEPAADLTFDVYRDGVRVASNLPGTTTSWEDPASTDLTSVTHCYAVSSTFRATATRSQHSAPRCYWGRDFAHVHSALAYDFANAGGAGVNRNGRFHFENWGDTGHSLTVSELHANATGAHLLQLTYANGAGGYTTGITCAVKRVRVLEQSGGREVAAGVFAMPQAGGWDQWRDSTFVRANLTAGRAYQVVIDDAPHAVNMSAFSHFSAYTGGNGGMSGAYNRVNIAELRLLPLEGLPRSNGALVALDGTGDFDAFAPTQRATPAIPYDTWDNFALDWDADYLYLARASPAFERTRERPLVIYLQSADAPAGAPRQGLTYSMQTPTVPFAAEYAIVLRRESDLADGAGPYNGVFHFDGARWQRSLRFVQGRHFWVGSDMNRTLSLRLPRAQLGAPTRLRWVAHVVTGGSNYNDTLPSTHQPWTATGGGHYETNLAGPRAASAWLVR